MPDVPVTSSAQLDAIIARAHAELAAEQHAGAQDRLGAVPQKSADRAKQDERARFTSIILGVEHWAPSSVIESYVPLLYSAAERYGFSPLLLWSIMYQESKGKADIVGGKGDRGLMQIVDSAWLARVGDAWKDPRTNIDQGAKVLQGKYRYFKQAGRPGEIQANARRLLRVTDPRVLAALVDPRPLYGFDLTQAAVAAYNGGEGRVVAALALGRHPDTVTAKGNYSASVLRRAGQKAQVLAQQGTSLSDLETLLAVHVGAPAGSTGAAAARKTHDIIKALERVTQMASVNRSELYPAAAALKVRLGTELQNQGTVVTNAAKVLGTANPGFVKDNDLRASSYDYETGLWGDDAPT